MSVFADQDLDRLIAERRIKLEITEGVQDVIVLDPRNGEVTHYRAGQTDTYHSPVVVTTVAGCRLTI